jgi:methyl-accepting chemotaxis protein
MENSRQQAHDGAEKSREGAAALEAITAAVATINNINIQIASAAEEQSAVSEEINRNVHSIVDISEQTATGSQQTTASADELSRLAMDLQGMVTQFRA